ncbi:MAG: hypothetical protein AO394_10160 [Candidatus Fermentibacter daniensis]|nr:MAG: hypothetical protein AO394_10160 [Candidatus Fermentibacter daniensis]
MIMRLWRYFIKHGGLSGYFSLPMLIFHERLHFHGPQNGKLHVILLIDAHTQYVMLSRLLGPLHSLDY